LRCRGLLRRVDRPPYGLPRRFAPRNDGGGCGLPPTVVIIPPSSLRGPQARGNPYGVVVCLGASISARMDCFVTSFLAMTMVGVACIGAFRRVPGTSQNPQKTH
jgi:hypothetical protein